MDDGDDLISGALGILSRIALAFVVVGVVAAIFAGCAAIKPVAGAVAGGGLGLLLGPAGAVAGAGLGAGGGAMWSENDRLKDELGEITKKNEANIELDRARIADLERRVAAIPSAPAADPTIRPHPIETRSWLRETPFQTVKRMIGWVT